MMFTDFAEIQYNALLRISSLMSLIKLPDTLAHQNLENLLKIMRLTDMTMDAEIDVDCSGLRWVDPAGLCLFRHWIESLNQRNVRLVLLDLPLKAESYMQRMDIFQSAPNLVFEDRTSRYSRNDLSDHLVEVHDVVDPKDADTTASRIARTIVSHLPLSTTADPEGMRPSEAERADRTISYVFSELLGNALSHGRRRGFDYAHAKVSAQHLRRSRRLQIAIFDDGCGLLGSLRGHSTLGGVETDANAIQAALRPRVSCNRDLDYGLDSTNQGIGLTVSTMLALESGGQFTIYSGGAAYNETALGDSSMRDTGGWQGTGVCLEFATEHLGSVDITAVVTSLPGYREEPLLTFE